MQHVKVFYQPFFHRFVLNHHINHYKAQSKHSHHHFALRKYHVPDFDKAYQAPLRLFLNPFPVFSHDIFLVVDFDTCTSKGAMDIPKLI